MHLILNMRTASPSKIWYLITSKHGLITQIIQSPCSPSPNQKSLRILRNPKVHHRVNNSPPLAPTPSQLHPFHNSPYYFSKSHSHIIFPSTPRSTEWSLPFRFTDQNFVRIYNLSHAATRPANLPPQIDHPNNIL